MNENTVVSLRGGGTLYQSGATGLFTSGDPDTKLILRDAMLKGNASNKSALVVMIDSSEFVMYGGTITGNTTDSGFGGGVGLGSGGTFTMSGGIIYGKDGTGNQNVATDGDTKGHAVFVYVDGYGDKYRDTTA